MPSGVRVPTAITAGLSKLGARLAVAARITGAQRVSPAGSTSALGFGIAKPRGGGGRGALGSLAAPVPAGADLSAGARINPAANETAITTTHDSTPGRENTRRLDGTPTP